MNKNLNRTIAVKNYYNFINRQVIKMQANKSNNLVTLTKDSNFYYVRQVTQELEFEKEYKTNSEEIALQEFNKQLGE